jgi:hypothetical protein
MTLTLSPEIERVLTTAAAKRGETPDELAEQTLRIKFGLPVGHVGPLGEKLRAQVNAALGMPPKELSAEEKEQRRQEALAFIRSGYFAERLSSSEEFSARKAEEKALEERRWHK